MNKAKAKLHAKKVLYKVRNIPILFAAKPAARSLTDFFSRAAPGVIPTTELPNAIPGVIRTISLSTNTKIINYHKNPDSFE